MLINGIAADQFGPIEFDPNVDVVECEIITAILVELDVSIPFD